MAEENKRKSSRVKKVAATVEPAASSAADPVNHVKLSDLWAMRVAQAEKRAALAEAEAAKFKRLYALRVLDPKGTILGIEAKLDEAKKSAERAENRELIAKKRMEADIGRSLVNLAIDPDTGAVVDPSKE